MANFSSFLAVALLFVGAGAPAWGQAPVVTATSPPANAVAAPRTSNVMVSFDRPLNAGSAAALKVFSAQRGGLRTAATPATVSGNTLIFAPGAVGFRPGETVQAVLTTAAQSSSGTALAAPRVWQFTAAAGGTGQGYFQPGSNPGVGNNTLHVLPADVDGDGDLDFLASNLNSNSVSVRLNNGSGNFSGGSEVGVGNNPYSLAVGDVDGDGDLDLLTANLGSGTVSIRLNNGSGGFAGGSDVAVGSGTTAVAVADLDGDGDLDLATSNNSSNSMSVRFNNGSGSFSGGANYPVGSGPFAVRATDVDNDGDLDLLVGNAGANTTSVRLNSGNGTFGNAPDLPIMLNAIGDVDADGDPDLAVANAAGNAVNLWLNNGNGTFSSGSTVSVGPLPGAIALGDVDADGDLDTVVLSSSASARTSVRFNNGSGSFSGSVEITGIGPTPFSLALGDLDGDGDLDMLTANQGNNTVSVRLNAPPAPTLTSLSPASGLIGSTISIDGTNLAGTTAIIFAGTTGNIPATGYTVNAAGTQITGVVVPAGVAIGNANVTVFTAGGASNALPFTVTTPPAPDLAISTGTLATPTAVAPGTYNTITVTNAGVAQLTGSTVVNTRLIVSGTLLTNCQLLTGTAFFSLANGATLGICDPDGFSLTPGTGAVRTTGIRSTSSGGNFLYNGTAAQVTGNALPTEVLNLTTTNPRSLTLTQPVRVKQLLAVNGTGDLNLNGQALTLLSDASGTALVVNGTTGVVQGSTATMQRYIDASGNSGPGGYRHYSSPVSGSTVADLTTSTFAPTLNAAYNGSTAPLAVQPFPTVFGYDEARLGASPATGLSDFDKGWYSPAALTDALPVGRGYTVQVGNTELLDFTGTLNTGPQTIGGLTRGAQPDAGWHLVGNPYPAPLDWSTVSGSQLPGLDAAIYLYQSTGPYAGRYRSLVNGVGAGSSLIPAGQGFFVRASTPGTTGSIALTNANRATTFAGQPALQRRFDPRPRLRLSLGRGSLPAPAATALDETFVYLEAGATPAFDGAYDAHKLPNPGGYYLASTSTDAAPLPLSVNGRPPLGTTDDVIPLWLSAPAGPYTLAATELANLAAPTGALTPYLRDALAGTLTDLSRQASYSFAVAAGAPSAGRFALVLRPAAPLATMSGGQLAGALASLYPNPTAAATTLSATGLPATAATLEAVLFDAVGRVTARFVLPVHHAAAAQALPTAGLSAGLYLLRLSVHDAQARIMGTLPAQRLVVR